jgi:hypothetical protein
MLYHNRQSFAPISHQYISRLGYRESGPAAQYSCNRNGDVLLLTIYTFQHDKRNKVLYFTLATDAQGNNRHKTLFQFSATEDHLLLHKLYLHQLFFDTGIGEHFSRENKFNVTAHNAQTESWQEWIRTYWNNNHFEKTYQELKGLKDYHQIIQD